MMLILLFPCISMGKEIKVIKKPEPNCFGTENADQLILTESVEELPSDELRAFAKISSAAVDKQGNFHLFDFKHGKIITLDSELKFVSSFGSKGEGPGEFRTARFLPPSFLTVGQDQHIYFAGFLSKKIKVFSLKGKFLGEFKVENSKPFRSIVDNQSNIYIPSVKKGYLLDIYDENHKYSKSIISDQLRNTYLFFAPPACVQYRMKDPDSLNLDYEFLSNGDIVLANCFDLSVSIINRHTGKIKHTFFAWEQYILDNYKSKLQKIYGDVKADKIPCGFSKAFTNMFVDNCDNIFISMIDIDKEIYIYQFSSKGKLLKVYRVNDLEGFGLKFFHHRDETFYAYHLWGVRVFKTLSTLEKIGIKNIP